MKRFLKTACAILALILLLVVAAAWWYLDSDLVDPPQLAGTMEAREIEHDGRTRNWVYYLPESLAEPAPVVLILHGSRGDGQQMLGGTGYGFNLLAEQYGFIPVYPDGFEEHWNDCRGSADYSANLQNVDDVSFLRALVKSLASLHDIDPSRIYAMGMSNGGQMAYRLGFEAPDFVAGIASIAANLPEASNLDCDRSGEPVSVLIVNGTEDPINPYDGGLVGVYGNTSRGAVISAGDSIHYWAKIAGYEGEGIRQTWPQTAPDDGTSIERTEWSVPGAPRVTLLTVVGGGHTMPHREIKIPRIIGRTSHEFDTAEVVWAFFAGEELLPD